MKKCSLVFGIVVLCLNAVPVHADMVSFSIGNVGVSYSGSLKTLSFSANGSLTGKYIPAAGPTQDVASDPGYYAFTGTLQLSKIASNDYTAAGTFTLKDLTGTSLVYAHFDSTSISLDNVDYGSMLSGLKIAGTLSDVVPGTSILVNESPWTFQGRTDGPPLAMSTLTVNDWQRYDLGTLGVVEYFFPQAADLDHLFGSTNKIGQGGQTTEFSIVPIPAAVLLGMLGLTAAGVGLRRFA